MKEQWKKLDSDAKLLVDVEEGRQPPIKINIPLTALTPARDDFCCNRLLTVLRVFVLLSLLALIGWTAMTFYGSYYARAVSVDDQSSLENTFGFQNLAYQNKEDFRENDEITDTTRKTLNLIDAKMKGFNVESKAMLEESRKLLEDMKEIERKREKDVDVKPVDEEASVSSDPTLDSMFDELAEKVGLAENRNSDKVVVEYKPELDAIVISEPLPERIVDEQNLQREEVPVGSLADLIDQLFGEQGAPVESAPVPINVDESYLEDAVPVELEHVFPGDERSKQNAQLDAIIRSSVVENEDVQKESFGMWDGIVAETMDVGHLDESHEEDKQVDQVIQALINRIAASDLESSDDDSEQRKEAEDKMEEESEENIGGDIVRGLIIEPLEILFNGEANEASKEEGLFENVEESHNEDKVEKEMMEQMNEDFQDDALTQFFNDAVADLLALEVAEVEEKESQAENEDEGYQGWADVFEDLPWESFVEPGAEIKEMSASDADYPTLTESVVTEQTDVAPIREEKSLIDVVPSVEYVQKIQANPFIPKIAKMLEPMVGQNHELLVWYYTHKDLPDFLRGADKWAVFGAKLLYDSNIKDYPADATIVLGLTFEKVLDVAEYPASNEEIQTDLQQEIVNRLILKSYLNKMLLEGNAEAETLSEVIERHNQEKLKELNLDPKQLLNKGDFFEVSNANKDVVIPVVQFDPFVDESKEVNEQRTRVWIAFGKTRTDEKIEKPKYDSKDFFSSISYKAPQAKVETSAGFETTEGNPEGFLGESVGTRYETTDGTEQFDDFGTWYDSADAGLQTKEVPDYHIPTAKTEEVDMNDYLYSYDGPYDW